MILILISSCGYKFSGGGNLPKGIKTLSVSILRNNSSQSGLENTLTNKINYELIKSGKVELLDSNAEAVLSGVIKSVSTSSVFVSSDNTAAEKRIIVVADLKLTSPEGEEIWVLKGVSEKETYETSSNNFKEEENKKSSLEILSGNLAEKIYNRLVEDF